MKNILLLCLLILLFSCKKDPEPLFKINGDAFVYVKADNNHVPLKSAGSHLTSLEVVKKATTMRFFNYHLGTGDWAAGFAGKDTVSAEPAFLRYGSDIITGDGFGKPYVVPDFIYANDIVIEIFRSNTDIDTIAYIPNAIMRKAENDILNALNEKDTAAVYVVFKDAFKFIPITGSEYRALKSKNLQ